jgi:riboflavin biosynthesis pyrimidine reductase
MKTDSNLSPLAHWPKQQFFVRAIWVESFDGSIAGIDSTSASLSNQTDRQYFKQVRAGADLSVIGAKTVRLEDPPAGPKKTLIISSRNDLNPTLRVFASDQTYLVSKNPLSFAKSVYAQLPLRGDSLKALLKDMDCERILVEGGAEVFNLFLESDLIDECLITISPKSGDSSQQVHLSDYPFKLSQEVIIDEYRYQSHLRQA